MDTEMKSGKKEASDPNLELQLCCRAFVARGEAGRTFKFSVNFIDGAMGKEGLQEVMQYIKNRAVKE